MPSPTVTRYRQLLAESGLTDDRDDSFIVAELGEEAQQKNPGLFSEDPEFGREWSQIREANAPSLAGEASRGLKRSTLGLLSTGAGGLSLFTGDGWLRNKARELETAAGSPDLQPTVRTLEDVAPGEPTTTSRVLSWDALRYGISKFWEAAPSIVEGVGTALIGAAAGSAVAPGPGTLAGGALGRTIVRRAIKELTQKGVKELTPELVVATAKQIGARAGGTAAAAVNSYVLNAGDVLSEIPDSPGLAAGVGIISAIPDTVLPALVLRRLFPGVAVSTAKEEAKKLVANKAVELGKKVGLGAAAVGGEGATEWFQEAVNVVARNIEDGVDPLTFNDEDYKRFREAGITGMAGGLLAAPMVAIGGKGPEATADDGTVPPPVAPPESPLPPAPATLPPTAPRIRTNAQIVGQIELMTPEEMVSRIAELQAKATLAADEETELELLLAESPTPPAAPVAAVAPASEIAPPVIDVGTPDRDAETPGVRRLFHGGPKPDGPLRAPVFLTSEREGAQWYADERGGESGAVAEYDVNVKNPLDIDTREGVKTLIGLAQQAGVEVQIKGDINGDGWEFFSPDISKHAPYDGGSPQDLIYIPSVRDALKRAGYDGLKLQDALENNFIDTIVALDAEQVRPVLGQSQPPAPEAIQAHEQKTAVVPKRERLISAAIRDAKTGKISTGTTHGHAKDPSVDTGGDAANVGFITDKGRYVGVEEAMGLTGGAGGSEEMAFFLKDAEVFEEEVESRVQGGMSRDDAIAELRAELEKRDRLESEGKSIGELTEWRRANGFTDDGDPVIPEVEQPAPVIEPPPGVPETQIAPLAPAHGSAPVEPVVEQPQYSRRQIADQRRKVSDLQKQFKKATAAGSKSAKKYGKQLDAEQMRLVEMEANKLTGIGPSVGMGPDGEPDLLTDIAEKIGKIRTTKPKTGTSAKGGEYDGWKDALQSGPAKLLNGGEQGMDPDDVLDMVNGLGYKFETMYALQDAVRTLSEKRKSIGASIEMSGPDYEQRTEEKFLSPYENKLSGTGPDRKRTIVDRKGGIPIENTGGIGAKFTINREKFSVVDMDEDASGRILYIVQDGKRFVVPEGEVVFPDKGSLKKPAKPTAPDNDPFAEKPVTPNEKLTPENAPKPETVAPLVPSTSPNHASPIDFERPTFEELRGQKVVLEGLDENGRPVEATFDAADAWVDTQQRRQVFKMLLDCLKRPAA